MKQRQHWMKLRPAYGQLFNTCIIKPASFPGIDRIADKIIANQMRYEGIGKPLNVPWYFIGIIHTLECNLSFEKHLHNGDPLAARTTHVRKPRILQRVESTRNL